jgi:hypothetical protein
MNVNTIAGTRNTNIQGVSGGFGVRVFTNHDRPEHGTLICSRKLKTNGQVSRHRRNERSHSHQKQISQVGLSVYPSSKPVVRL